MAGAGLLAKLIDESGERLLKALVVSVALHLAVVTVIQPAHYAGPVEVVLQARIANAPHPHASPPPAEAETPPEQAEPAKDALPQSTAVQTLAPPATDRPIPLDMTSTPAPSQMQPESQPAELGSAETPAPTAQAKDAKTEIPNTAAFGSGSALPEIPVMVDTRWYTARQVDRRPEILTPVLPVYPEEARRRGIEGSVVIEVHIDESGRVREIEVLEANPPGVFDAVVLEVYGQARYSPAILNGRPVRYIGKYRVLFELD